MFIVRDIKILRDQNLDLFNQLIKVELKIGQANSATQLTYKYALFCMYERC